LARKGLNFSMVALDSKYNRLLRILEGGFEACDFIICVQVKSLSNPCWMSCSWQIPGFVYLQLQFRYAFNLIWFWWWI